MVVTSQIFSILYYECPVWLNTVLNKKKLKNCWKFAFYGTTWLFVIIGNTSVGKWSQRSPDKWSKFALASAFLSMLYSNQPTLLLTIIMSNFYSKSRRPGFMYFYDAYGKWIRKQATKNWIDTAPSDITVPLITKNSIRVLMKKSFYKWLNKNKKRCTPKEWGLYTSASVAMKVIRDQQPKYLHQRLLDTLYTCRRTPSIGHFYNNAKGKIGKQSLENRLMHMDSLKTDWLGLDWNDDRIWINLKKTFFTSYIVQEWLQQDCDEF